MEFKVENATLKNYSVLYFLYEPGSFKEIYRLFSESSESQTIPGSERAPTEMISEPKNFFFFI